MSAPAPAAAARPAVSVIVPFYGGADEARRLADGLAGLRLRPGDEVLVADNTPGQIAGRGIGDSIRVVPAGDVQSSYSARNLGAEAACNDWLLFMDSDCRPSPGLLDGYFTPPIPDDWGAVGGRIDAARGQTGTLARYAMSRAHLRQPEILDDGYRPMVVTANVLVRRAAWAQVGGFQEGIRSAGDSDFSWRLQDAGWELGYRDDAAVEHRFRESLPDLARVFARYGAGSAWARRRHLDYPRPPLVRGLARCLAGVVGWTLTGRFERARFKAIDAVLLVAGATGGLMGNVSRGAADRQGTSGGPAVLAVVDLFPELTQTFVAGELSALGRAGLRVRVQAGARALAPDWRAARGVPVDFLEDDGAARKAADLAWLVARHPIRSARDLLAQQRWRREEKPWPLRSLAPAARRAARGGPTHLHAYFAAGAALNALRLSRLVRLPYSVTAYAFEIYRSPSNLKEKLAAAAFVATVSEMAAGDLRALAPERADRIHVVGMGVDGERFRRLAPPPGGRTVLAVGRLVEKKGFEVLIRSAALLRARGAVERVLIAGEGPQRPALEARIAAEGLTEVVRLLGVRSHAEMPGLMAEADVFAMPCVVAPDGDRDSLPAVVSEALAMELPVAGSDAAGLPEVLHGPWGRVAPAGDAAALAAALEELLDLTADERAAAGRAGREWILRHRDPATEARKVARLIAQSTKTR